ncbi:MAG TPA: hypothetical protein VLE23_08265, partial [Geminicoccaceae bacterium]|nr:hypothetical protein [Geminicoccaceae bacterium]
MIRRLLVWPLGILALLGAGWLVYEPVRLALYPVAQTIDPSEADRAGASDESGRAALPPTTVQGGDNPPGSASGTGEERPAAGGERAVDWARLRELAPGAAAPAPPAAVEETRVARATPAAVRPAPEAEVIEPSVPPAARNETVERVPAAQRMLDTIRQKLATILGGPPEASDPSPATVEEPSATVAAVDPSSRAEPEPIRPSFDIVRVERDGRTVVAGRAAPGAEVELRAGDRVIDRVRANRRGEWVATPSEPLAAGGQELSVAARSPGAPAIEAEQVVVVVVPGPPPQSVAVAAATPPAEPLAVLLPKAGGGGGRILQAPGRISSDGRLALVVLDYDESGRTRLIGEAPPGVPVRIYVDDQP